MNFSGGRIKIALIVLYVFAVWVRFSDAGDRPYPYFNGESGTNYRHAQMITNGGLPASDTRAAWPDGFSPSRVKPNGVEYAVGQTFRLASLFTDSDERAYARTFTILFFSLSVFVMYALVSRLWQCQAAGFFAAALVAFLAPLVHVTNGTEFLHAPFAFVLVACHLALMVAYRERPRTITAAAAAVVVAALFACWSGAGTYAAAAGVLGLLLPGIEARERRLLLTTLLAAVFLSAALLPHLRAARFVAAWPSVLLLVLTLYTFVGGRLPRRIPGIVAIIGGFAVLWLLYRPLQASNVEPLGYGEYWLQRLRHLAGKPLNPARLSETVRYLWTRERSAPGAYDLLQILLPFGLLVPVAVVALVQRRRETGRSFVAPLVLAAVGCVFYVIDRSTLFAALLGLCPLAAAAFVSFRRYAQQRILVVSLAVVLIVLQLLFPYSASNPAHWSAALVGSSHDSRDSFRWVSLGNADLDLVRFVVSRTSTRHVILAPPEVSSLLATFAGRITLVAPGIRTKTMMDRTNEVTSLYFGSEKSLFAACDSMGVAYVLYRIDYLLDRSRFSDAYRAGHGPPGGDSVAYRMHFAPEALTNFLLVYENDLYRLFRVTNQAEPMFLTDHPPVYQGDIMARYGDSLEEFYDRVIDILITYHTGVRAQARGNDEEAIRRFRYCLDQAPKFTRAWIGVGESSLRLNDLEAANAAYMRALACAPDDPRALYYGALTLGRMGKTEQATGLLDVLLTATRDREWLARARSLRTVLATGGNIDEPGSNQ